MPQVKQLVIIKQMDHSLISYPAKVLGIKDGENKPFQLIQITYLDICTMHCL